MADFLKLLSQIDETSPNAERSGRDSDIPTSYWRELVATPSGQQAHQAGAPEFPDGSFVQKMRQGAERNLYFFAKGIIGRNYLTDNLHLPLCRDFLQRRLPARKGMLLPRNHAKSSIVSHALPPHILIQPAADNIYFPGIPGSECRILLAGETESMAGRNLMTIKAIFTENKLFRALWPACCYDGDPRRAAKKWNETEIIIPRSEEYPDPSIKAIGVGGAITGARPNVLIKDDLISIEARNSALVMSRAIDWHIASRALMDQYESETGLCSLEWIIGTRWAVFDLYSYIIDNDPTVEWNTNFRSIIQNGEPIWPERFSLADVENLKKEFGSLFPLLYMNDASDPELVDFSMDLVRYFTFDPEGNLNFESDMRDTPLSEKHSTSPTTIPAGISLTPDVMNEYLLRNRDEYFRFRGN